MPGIARDWTAYTEYKCNLLKVKFDLWVLENGILTEKSERCSVNSSSCRVTAITYLTVMGPGLTENRINVLAKSHELLIVSLVSSLMYARVRRQLCVSTQGN